jgi:predicted phage tail protein
LDYALQKHTKTMVNDLEQNKNITPKSFFKYLQEDLKDSGVGGPQVSYDEYVTKVDEAESDLNRFFVDYLGRSATDEEQKKYYKELRALEKKNAQVTTQTETDSGGSSRRVTGEYQLDAEDILQLQRGIAGKALDGSDIDVILKGGSTAAQAVNSTLAYAKKYGVTLSNKDALKYVSSSLQNNDKDTSKINAKLLAVSKATYSNLADVLSEDVDLDDLSANYKSAMRQILEIPDSQIDVLNPTIQMALKNNGNKGAMNLTEFERVLKKDPRWGNTSNARETAAGYANSILRNFGLIA